MALTLKCLYDTITDYNFSQEPIKEIQVNSFIETNNPSGLVSLSCMRGRWQC